MYTSAVAEAVGGRASAGASNGRGYPEALNGKGTRRFITRGSIPMGYSFKQISKHFQNIFCGITAAFSECLRISWSWHQCYQYPSISLNFCKMRIKKSILLSSIVYEMLQCSASILENWQTCALLLWWWCRSLRKTANFWENVRRTM